MPRVGSAWFSMSMLANLGNDIVEVGEDAFDACRSRPKQGLPGLEPEALPMVARPGRAGHSTVKVARTVDGRDHSRRASDGLGDASDKVFGTQ